MMSAGQRAAIRQLVQSPQWQAVSEAAEAIKRNVLLGRLPSGSEWETVKAAIEREAKVEAIESFLQQLLELAL